MNNFLEIVGILTATGMVGGLIFVFIIVMRTISRKQQQEIADIQNIQNR